MANTIIDGKQCIICWYVDDTDISYEDSTMVDEMIAKIEDKFRKMTVNRGKEHNFVGMDISLKKNGTLQILTKEYIKESITTFGEEMKKDANTPAKHNIFTISESKLLISNKADTFYHIVAKLLYVCKMERV